MHQDRRGWHIDKGIPVVVILALLTVVWQTAKDQARQDERISLVETSVNTLQQARVSDQIRTEKNFDELKENVKTINAKLDRLIETNYGR